MERVSELFGPDEHGDEIGEQAERGEAGEGEGKGHGRGSAQATSHRRTKANDNPVRPASIAMNSRSVMAGHPCMVGRLPHAAGCRYDATGKPAGGVKSA